MAIRLFHGARTDGDSGRVALFVLQMEEMAIKPAQAPPPPDTGAFCFDGGLLQQLSSASGARRKWS
jgi:hypothetical protein